MGGSNDARNGGEDSNTRPWTTGKINGNELSAGGNDRSVEISGQDGSPGEGGGLLCRARSADGISMSPLPMGPDLVEKQAEQSDDAIVPKDADTCAADSQAGGTGQPYIDGTVDIDGADEKTDVEDVEFLACVPQQMPRRVSFADEQALDDSVSGSNSSVDSNGQTSGQSQQRTGWGAQRRRMSNLIGSSNGYLDSNGGTQDQLLDKDGRRKSDIERCRKAMELARAAHELLFTDTRPDGLRPITGSPMTDGRDALGSGGLYFGLAGLKGFDLSFVGALSTNQSGGGQYPRSISARLAASRRLSASTVADDKEAAVVCPPTESPSKTGASWIAQGSLLDRKPGSLRPKFSRSARCSSSPETGQTSPTSGGLSGTADGSTGNANTGSSPPNTASCLDLHAPQMPKPTPTSPTQATNSNSNAEGVGDPSTALLHQQHDTLQTSGILYGSEKDDSGCERPGESRGDTRLEDTKIEDDGKSVASKLPDGTTAVSYVATAMASLFAPKPAVLWSAREMGVEELVFSTAGDQEVKKLSKQYIRHACAWVSYEMSPRGVP